MRLWPEAGAVRFDFSDDGAGFDAGTKTGNGGLTRVADTVGALGGTVEIESTPGWGTRVTGCVPLAS